MGLEQTERNVSDDGTITILAMDRNSSNLTLLSKFLSREGYEVIGVSSIEDFEGAIASDLSIRLAIIDISGFDRFIWNCCEELRSLELPFLVISPQQSTLIKQQGMNYGAKQILVKPLMVQEFLQIIENLINN